MSRIYSHCGGYVADLEGEVVESVALSGIMTVGMILLRWVWSGKLI